MNVKITSEKMKQLKQRMEGAGIRDCEIEEKFIRSSGPGGEKINKTSSCVYLKHKPSGIEVKCSQSRYQSVNRFLARRLLIEKIESILYGKLTERERERVKIKKQKLRRKRKARNKYKEMKK